MRTFIFITLFASLGVGPVRAQEIPLPSDPLEGRIVFEEKGCIRCHAIEGYGGTTGPDLGRDHFYGGFMALASAIWNHIPEMNRKFRQIDLDRPRLTQTEMHELTGFLYYLRYLGEPGSVSRGKRLLESGVCIQCHSLAGQGGDVGPEFEEIQQNASPLFMAQAMWNHMPDMLEEIEKRDVDFPELSGQDLDDMSAFLQMAARNISLARMSPGNPAAGKNLFEEKKCSDCHAIRGEEEKLGPNLDDMDLEKNVTEIAALMWNHSPDMFDHMEEKSVDWPQFEGDEMANVIAFLYFSGFEDEPGDVRNGERVFNEKGCVWCHEEGGEGDGPDLSEVGDIDSPLRMLQLMWNHAPDMEDMILVKNEDWPLLSELEMRDLFSYLKNISSPE